MPEQTNKPDPLAQAVDLCCHYIAENRSLTERLNDAERRLAEIGIKDPETHTEVAALVAALHLFCPGTYVTHGRAGPQSAWVQQVRIPLAGGAYILVRQEVDGWNGVAFGTYVPSEGLPLEHQSRDSLMEVLRDAVAYALIVRSDKATN